MIRRLIKIARAEFSHFMAQGNSEDAGRIKTGHGNDTDPITEPRPAESDPGPDPLAGYYANLEIPPGSDRTGVQKAWKRLMKMYHPDLHSTEPEKRRQAEELTRRLTEAYRILDENLKKKAGEG